MLALQQAPPIGNVVGDPLSVLLVVLGATFVSAAMLVLGYLALGAAVDLVTATRPARTHGR